jgi:hypothetical protein
MTMVVTWFGTSSQLGEALATAVGHRLVSWQTTVTVKLQELARPALSVARQMTVVVPQGKVLPDGGTQLKLLNPHGSEAAAM